MFQRVLFVVLGLSLFVVAAQADYPATEANVGYGFNGSWYNPQLDGQGFVVEYVLRPNGAKEIVTYWFTYDAFKTKTVWLIASGPLNTVAKTASLNISRVTNGQFMAVPQPVTETIVGRLDLQLMDCNTLSASWTFTQSFDGLAAGSVMLTRLTPVLGVEGQIQNLCTTPVIGQPEGQACFYEEDNFKGPFFCLKTGQSNLNLNSKGIGIAVSSVKVTGDAEAIIYGEMNRGYGVERALPYDAPNLSWLPYLSDNRWSLNDKVFGVEVRTKQSVCAYTEVNYKGDEYCFAVGHLHRYSPLIIASLKFPPNSQERHIKLIVSDETNFSGIETIFTQSIPDLSQVAGGRYYKNIRSAILRRD